MTRELLQNLEQLLRGCTAMACFIAAVFFLKFWRKTRERLFGFFSFAFLIFGLHWIAFGLINPSSEARHYLFSGRLIVFLVILAAIVDKTRRGKSG